MKTNQIANLELKKRTAEMLKDIEANKELKIVSSQYQNVRTNQQSFAIVSPFDPDANNLESTKIFGPLGNSLRFVPKKGNSHQRPYGFDLTDDITEISLTDINNSGKVQYDGVYDMFYVTSEGITKPVVAAVANANQVELDRIKKRFSNLLLGHKIELVWQKGEFVMCEGTKSSHLLLMNNGWHECIKTKSLGKKPAVGSK